MVMAIGLYYVFCFLLTSIMIGQSSSLVANTIEIPLQDILRSYTAGSIFLDPDGVGVYAINVNFLSAGDAIVTDILSVHEQVISGSLQVNSLTSAGVVHNDASGNISSSLIVNADITPGTITNASLATISSSNTAGNIVVRDSSGNFVAGTITAALSGNATTATSATSATTATTATSATTATTATNFSGSLAGDVTGTQSATVVSTVGGQTAANVAAGAVLANAATNLDTNSAIVKRDAAGNFAASMVSVTDVIASLNLILSTDPSTSSAGNILKGSNRFIHDCGTNNTFVGISAGNFTTSGSGNNTGLGANALTANTTGANNSAIGYNALDLCTTGSNNIAIGSGSGGTLTTGSNNIYLSANAATSSEANTIRIGTSGTQTGCYIQGISGASLLLSGTAVVVTSAGQLGTVLSTQKIKRNIKDMDDASSHIFELRPVTFTYKGDATDTEQFGLIAEEVAKAFPLIVINDEYGEPLTVQYHILPVLLLNEIKKQHIIIKEQQRTIDALYITVEDVVEAVGLLHSRLERFIERIEKMEIS